ncbi:MAG: hypothetical protein IPN94_09155 [Sphingobacteriales bacterium]|nr:hypothetical protein [Sphingobacteriales bacterium]
MLRLYNTTSLLHSFTTSQYHHISTSLMFNHIILMGSFLKYLFATVFGIFLFFIVAILLMAVIGFFASSKGAVNVKPNSIMNIKVDYQIEDRSKTTMPSLTSFSFDDKKLA